MDDRQRPSFARDFPRTPALDALVQSFADGDYRRVRAEADAVAGSSEDEAVRQACRTLVARTNPDPLAVGLIILTGALLLAVSGYWMVHGKAPPPASPAIERVR